MLDTGQRKLAQKFKTTTDPTLKQQIIEIISRSMKEISLIFKFSVNTIHNKMFCASIFF